MKLLIVPSLITNKFTNGPYTQIIINLLIVPILNNIKFSDDPYRTI